MSWPFPATDVKRSTALRRMLRGQRLKSLPSALRMKQRMFSVFVSVQGSRKAVGRSGTMRMSEASILR